MIQSIAKQTSNAPPILVLRVEFAKDYGMLESLILNQILYWSERSGQTIDGVVWIYNTIEQWHEQFPFTSERSIRRALRKLETLGFIQSDRKEAQWWNQRKWYSLNRETLEPYISQMRPNCPDQDGQSGHFKNKDYISKITEETNTSEPAPNSIKPPTHPVVCFDLSKEGIEAIQAGVQPNHENQEKEQEPKRDILVKPKLKTENVPNLNIETIYAAPIPAEIETKILETIAPSPLNQNIRNQVMQAQSDVILDAVSLVNQQKAQGKAKNPAGLLVKAIQNNWKPNAIQENVYSIPDDFNEWFDLARKSGLAIASSLINGVLCVYTNAHRWEPYENFRAGFSLPWLKKTLGIC
ncbi:MAG: PadR family transcriptional regulator [Acaryochloridaceae cyanobacterium RU_4_10]|nr:PadR family transcriptional regulator [Acaryochloridaceae cyanobacterium RU_4_10]